MPILKKKKPLQQCRGFFDFVFFAFFVVTTKSNINFF
jgi:hypothetical protein